jgi:hypothetical protein
MKTMTGVTLAIGLLLIGVAATPAQADQVILSNLGPGDSYRGSDGWPLGISGEGTDYFGSGCAFTVGATSVELATIQLAVGHITGTNSLTINFDADSGGSPGATIESFTINGAMPNFGSYSSDHLVKVTSVLHPLLTAGSQYWVVLSVPNDGTSAAAWNWNSIGDFGPFVLYNGSQQVFLGTNVRGAMLITAVPEPSCIVMVSTGVVVMLGCGLRRLSRTGAA